MKTKTKIKVGILSFLVFLLIGVMVVCALFPSVFGGFFKGVHIGFYTSYANSEKYLIGNGEARDITKVEINWYDGEVEVVTGDTDKILFKEDYTGEDEDFRMRYWVDGSVLRIQYCKSRLVRFQNNEKKLTLTVPTGMHFVDFGVDAVSTNVKIENIEADSLDVETVSGELLLNHIKASEVSLETVSGGMVLNDVKAEDISLETVSGNMSLDGITAQELDMESVSGDIEIKKSSFTSLEQSSVSGNVTLSFLEDVGFAIDFDTVSGDLDSDVEVRKENGKYIHGDGKVCLEFETVSGNVRVIK